MSRSRATRRALALPLVIGLLVAAATATPAAAGADRIAWSVERVSGRVHIVWRGSTPLPMGGARLEVRRNGAFVGVAREAGSEAVLDLPATSARLLDSTGLELWRSGRRVDLTAPPARSSAAADASKPSEPVEPAGPAATAADPGARGPYATERLGYQRSAFAWPEYPQPIEMLAEVTTPTVAPGARPFVLILHGRHSTCFTGGPNGSDSGDWPCPAGWQPIPSYLGYRVIADLLASQGNIVVSISANGINGQDYLSNDGGAAARAALVRRHLRLWDAWNRKGTDPWGGRFQGAVDLTNVVLIGHSRGGEGVARAAIDNSPRDPWRVRGLVAIAPTAFGQQIPAYVHTAVILPYCDGDVSDLEGQVYVDGGRDLFRAGDPALRSAVMVMGANHNYFNSEWTPGTAQAPAIDDWLYNGSPDDPRCGVDSRHRLSPHDQQDAGATYSAALVEMTLNDDATMLQYLDGPAASPPSADGAEVHVTAIGGDRVPLYEAGVTGTARVSTNGSITAQPCDGYASSGASCSAGFGFNRVPHWVFAYAATDKPAPKALELNWTAKGTVRLKFKQPIDLQASAAVDLRIALDPKSDPAAFEVRAIDANGGSATLGTRTVFPMPGRKRIGKVWARSLRAPLRDAVGFDRTRVVALQLVAVGGTGHGFLLDAMGVGKHLLAMPARRPARADVATIEVPEGDTPGQHVQVPVTLDPPPPAGARVWVEVAGITATSGSMQTIAAGATSFDVTVTWDGDTVAFGDQFVGIAVFGLANITTRQYLGGVWIRDDD